MSHSLFFSSPGKPQEIHTQAVVLSWPSDWIPFAYSPFSPQYFPYFFPPPPPLFFSMIFQYGIGILTIGTALVVMVSVSPWFVFHLRHLVPFVVIPPVAFVKIFRTDFPMAHSCLLALFTNFLLFNCCQPASVETATS